LGVIGQEAKKREMLTSSAWPLTRKPVKNIGYGRFSDLPLNRRPSRRLRTASGNGFPVMQAFEGQGLQQRALSGIFTRFPIMSGSRKEHGPPLQGQI